MQHHHHEDKHKAHNHSSMVKDFRRRFFISVILTLPILMLSPMLRSAVGIDHIVQFVGEDYFLWFFSTLVFFYGGWPFLKGMMLELKVLRPGMMTLIGIAITVSYVYSSAVVFGLSGMSFFWELATLIDIMLLGHWIEMKSIMGASRALEELVRVMPSSAHKLDAQNNVYDVKINDLLIGDRILVRPGEKIPADGMVIDGISDVDESMLTGESQPVEKSKNALVIAGALNGDGALTIEVNKNADQFYLYQVIKLVKEAQASKSEAQHLGNRAALVLTIIALFSGALTITLWWLFKKDFAFAIERAVTVMVIACPHALGLAIPLVIAVSTTLAAKNGLLIRNRIAFERARKIDAVIFDKTGTLTEGKFGVTDVVIFNERTSQEEFLAMIAAVEIHSEHPIAKGIVAKKTSLKKNATNFKSMKGQGTQADVDGKLVAIVSSNYVQQQGLIIPQEHQLRLTNLLSEGKTVIHVLVDEKPYGAVALADIIRSDAKKVIDELKSQGIVCIMLTGDNDGVARKVANEIGIDEYFAEVLPHIKKEKISDVQKRGLTVAMVGDGVNDAPALAQANLGIAIGAGTDVAIETADVVLVKNNLQDVLAIFDLSKITYRKMIENLLWATGYNAFAMPLAAGFFYSFGVLLSPAVGAMLMTFSTVIVALNAQMLRLKKSRES